MFVGRGVLDPAVGAAVGGLLLATLVFVGVHGNVYAERRRGPSYIAILILCGLGLLVVAASVPGLVAGFDARRSLERGREMAQAAIAAARRGEPDDPQGGAPADA